MTDRIKGFTVILEHDIRVDDVQGLMEAMCMLKGVSEVIPSTATPDDHMNRARVRGEFRNKLIDFLNDQIT